MVQKATVLDNDEATLVATNTTMQASQSDETQWLLDTGCSNHMSNKKDMFTELDETFQSSVKIGDDTKIHVLGKGKIGIKLKNGSQSYISDVFYAPAICQYLLSVWQLVLRGYEIFLTHTDVESHVRRRD